MHKIGRPDEIHLPSGTSKREVYGWKNPGTRGEFRMLEKGSLCVDPRYQRSSISSARVRQISTNFNWSGFGVINVALRDGVFYVFDGQHRVLGALRRDDVTTVPCIVFVFDDLPQEAVAFILSNTMRGPVTAIQKFHAKITANDTEALVILSIVEEFGYFVPSSAQAKENAICCVQALHQVYGNSPEVLRRVLSVVRQLYGSESPTGSVVRALAYLDRHLHEYHGDNLMRKDVLEKILKLGGEQLKRAMTGMSEALGKSGDKIWCAGLVQKINKGKTSRRIRSVMGE